MQELTKEIQVKRKKMLLMPIPVICFSAFVFYSFDGGSAVAASKNEENAKREITTLEIPAAAQTEMVQSKTEASDLVAEEEKKEALSMTSDFDLSSMPKDQNSEKSGWTKSQVETKSSTDAAREVSNMYESYYSNYSSTNTQQTASSERTAPVTRNYNKIKAQKEVDLGMNNNQKEEPIQTELQQAPKKRTRSGFYTGESAVNQVEHGSKNIAAVIHGSQNVQNNTTVKLRTVQDATIENITIPKNTYVYGIATINSNRVMINISSINVSGNVIPAKLTVYATDGIKGILINDPGTKEVTNDAVEAATNETVTGIGVVDRTIGAITRKKKSTDKVYLSSGSAIILKGE